MSTGGLDSPLHFESFKIENLELSMQPRLDILGVTGSIDPNAWDINFQLRVPSYIKSVKKYIGGFDLQMGLHPKTVELKDKTTANALISLRLGIVGLFRVDEGRLTKDVEKKLIKVNIPMILMPYARGTITSLFANGGYGSVILPLINIIKLSESSLKDIDIMEIE